MTLRYSIRQRWAARVGLRVLWKGAFESLRKELADFLDTYQTYIIKQKEGLGYFDVVVLYFDDEKLKLLEKNSECSKFL
jgi:hypothetical protein